MPTIIIRSLPGRLGFVVVAVMAAVGVAAVLVSDGARNGLRALGWAGLLVLAAWALWWAPSVTLSDESLTVSNAWRRHTLRWEDVVGCRTRWSLEILLDGGGRVVASAAQRPGGLVTSFRRRQEMRRREVLGGAGRVGAVGTALEHRGVREEFLDPGGATHRTVLDSQSPGDLLKAYADRRAAHHAVLERLAHRQERLNRRREGERRGRAPDRRPDGAAAGTAGAARAGGVSGAPGEARSGPPPAAASAPRLPALLALAADLTLIAATALLCPPADRA